MELLVVAVLGLLGIAAATAIGPKLGFSAPLLLVVVGILVLDEPFEARLLVGGALTVAGIAAVSYKPRVRVPQPSVAGP